MATTSVVVDGHELIGLDSSGGTWKLLGLTGWHDLPAVRRNRLDKAQQDGAWPSSGFTSGRAITATGTARFPDAVSAKLAARQLRSLGGSGESSMTVIDSGGALSATVERDGVSVEVVNERLFNWTVALFAPDPLLYGTQAFGSTDLAGQAGTGLQYPADQVAATNSITNPSFELDQSNWSTWAGNGSPVQTTTRETSGGFSGRSFLRSTWSTPPSDGGGFYTASLLNATSGGAYTVSAYIRPSVTLSVYPQLQWFNSGTATALNSGSTTSCPAGVWTRVTFTGTCPAGSNQVQWRWYIAGTGITAAGQTLDLDAAQMVAGSDPLVYFDGDMPFDGTYSYRWTGTPGASSSEKYVMGGLAYPLSYGVASGSSPGAIPVGNSGTATYWPRLRIDGPVSNPVVTCLDTGDWIRYNGDLLAGQWLDIDCGNRQVLLNGQVAVRKFVSASGTWLAIPSGGASLSWAADTADPAARLSVWSYEGVWS